MTRNSFLALVALVGVHRLSAQDTTRVEEGVRIGVDYSPGVRPGLVVLPGSGLDSVRAMVRRDLDYSDRFEMITVADLPPSATTGRGSGEDGGGVNYALYKSLGAQFAVELTESPNGATARLHDVNTGRMQSQKAAVL